MNNHKKASLIVQKIEELRDFLKKNKPHVKLTCVDYILHSIACTHTGGIQGKGLGGHVGR